MTPWLIAVAALVGILTVHFDVAYQSYLPVLVERDLVLYERRHRYVAPDAIWAEGAVPTRGGTAQAHDRSGCVDRSHRA